MNMQDNQRLEGMSPLMLASDREQRHSQDIRMKKLFSRKNFETIIVCLKSCIRYQLKFF